MDLLNIKIKFFYFFKIYLHRGNRNSPTTLLIKSVPGNFGGKFNHHTHVVLIKIKIYYCVIINFSSNQRLRYPKEYKVFQTFYSYI